MAGIMMPYMGDMAQMGYIQPNQIPSLNLWYNASASSTVVNGTSTPNFDTNPISNGITFAKWKDLSGVGQDANVTGGTGNQPTYTIPIQNGLGSVTYNSTNSNNLDINPLNSWIANLSGFTLYVLARPTSFSGTVFPLTVTDNSFGIWWNGSNWTVGYNASNYGTVSVTNDTTKFHIYGMVFTGGSPGTMQFRYDKSAKTLTQTGSPGLNTGSQGAMFFGGDARNSGTFKSTYMNGYIGEVLIWTRALSSSELTSVESYLNQKWGLGLI